MIGVTIRRWWVSDGQRVDGECEQEIMQSQ